MAAKKQNSQERKLVDAALKLATEGKWSKASLADIAVEAKVKLSEIYALARTRGQVLDLVEQDLTLRTVDEVGELDPNGTVRENLFDLLMTRFETMNANRAAFLCLSKNARSTSLQSCQPDTGLKFLANLAGVESGGILGSGRMLIIQQLYLKVLDVWRGDETEDLSPTMKLLDTELAKAETWAQNIANFDLNSFFKPAHKETAQKEAST